MKNKSSNVRVSPNVKEGFSKEIEALDMWLSSRMLRTSGGVGG